ncbi:MAG: alpha/beta hydrolase-fold protein [Ferruginibacter sp.]
MLSSFYNKFLFALVSICYVQGASAQYSLTLQLTTVPGNKAGDNIYAAGNFNGWNPGNEGYRFTKNADNTWQLVIKNLPAENYEFKFTRGSWDKVACASNGNDIANNAVQLKSDTVLQYSVQAWKDDFVPVPKQHTASGHVAIIDTAFYMPQLNRSRRIWLYLPQDYADSKKRFPVLYMHDGQNLFDAFTSGYGEWGVDECLDTLTRNNHYDCIVVGIDNGPQRLNEYNPFDNERFGKGEGKQYVDFLVNTLKPFIDDHYRTLKDKNNTMIAGSSMGGLISYAAALYYPSVFGKAGVFSPAFWTAIPGINDLTDSLAVNNSGKFFFFMGGKEGEEYMNDMFSIMQSLGTRSSALIYSVVDPEGKHNEAAWCRWFPEFLKFMMADWTNYIIDTAGIEDDR